MMWTALGLMILSAAVVGQSVTIFRLARRVSSLEASVLGLEEWVAQIEHGARPRPVDPGQPSGGGLWGPFGKPVHFLW